MAAPKGSELSKAEFILAQNLLNQLVADGVTAGSTTVTNTLTAIQAEIDAR